MSQKEMEYDVVIIGSGPSGRTVSLRSVKSGLSVVLIEDELVGGDCHYWACIPSKALLRPPEALEEARQVDGAREALNNNELNVDSVLARRDEFVDHWKDSKIQGMLEKSGVKVIHGRGRLNGPHRVIVDSSDGSESNFFARRAVVLSGGSRSAIPPIPGLAESRPWTNRDATGAKKAPSRLAVLGGGPVAAEMATAWSSLGAREIIIIERGERLLGKYEPFVGERLGQVFRKKGITVLTGVNIRQVKRIEGRQKEEPVEITLDNESKIVSDEILVATGRKPNTEDLGLETVGLTPGGWLEADDTCLVKGVDGGWLCSVGDINHRALLTHMGKYQARACVEAIVARMRGMTKGNDNGSWSKWAASADHAIIPQVIFTDPQIATVGLTDQVARSMGMNVRAVDCEIGAVDGARLHVDDYDGHALIIVDEDRHVLVGATLIGPQVAEMIHAATVAIVGEVSLETLWHAVPSFPTVSEL
ncbi:MAG: dihydrolipoyl dehydrogenase family protein [Nitrososphaerales archaeon]